MREVGGETKDIDERMKDMKDIELTKAQAEWVAWLQEHNIGGGGITVVQRQKVYPRRAPVTGITAAVEVAPPNPCDACGRGQYPHYVQVTATWQGTEFHSANLPGSRNVKSVVGLKRALSSIGIKKLQP